MDDVKLISFAPLQYYKMKVRDSATNKEHIYVVMDLGDDSQGKPFPLVVLDGEKMKEQKAMAPGSTLLKAVQNKILAYRKTMASGESAVQLPEVDL